MRISARNTLTGAVKTITLGEVNAEIVLDLGNGVELTSTITRHSAERLGLAVGTAAHAVIKSSDVMIGVD
ncbi:molybdopterin-binding protein [Deinococcus metalli]|uniref:Molybdopterin-binding protein n=1 Tax=Deinococcus metalli TaxID=1141878 RepID=A0A7W8NQ99_9DEIO|nr:molybdopterin-binding protein [Deinococcus metalli]MBB5376580.1 molybdopterin-binding protein [Deinococcus metalli]GHF42999.1 transporter [Deinococcus metalli]